ncbi:hypothetical protein D918_01687 [Trichuris suis]|nr:hypothetical protein D918_01687 [Trichuris suis]
MLSTTDTYTQSASSASCALNVIDPSTSEPVLQATVGQKLRMQLVATSIGDNQQVIPRNCMVVNMENGERYPLTDQNGCSLDSTLFPNWQTKSRGQLYSDFSTFKWPETAIIQFQCDCSICMENCARAVSPRFALVISIVNTIPTNIAIRYRIATSPEPKDRYISLRQTSGFQAIMFDQTLLPFSPLKK